MIFAFLKPVKKASSFRHSQGEGEQLTKTLGKNVQRLKKKFWFLPSTLSGSAFFDKFRKSAYVAFLTETFWEKTLNIACSRGFFPKSL